MAECTELCDLTFGKSLMKLLSYKIVNPSLADSCTSHSKLIRSVTKEFKLDFLNFDKTEQHLYEILWNYVGNAPSFTDLREQ